MRQSNVDFLVIGASPLAHLLAGLLATEHGKSVLVQGELASAYRLQRNLDLSVAAIARPESWALLRQTVPETTRLVTRIGKRASIARLDPILSADTASGKQALGHVRHMAMAHGVAAEPMPVHFLGRERAGVVLRDVVMLRRAVLEPALQAWLADAGVRQITADTPLRIAAGGSAACEIDGDTISIGQTILADDEAIQVHLAEAAWPALLQRQAASSILTRPNEAIAAAVMLHLDGAMTLNRQDSGAVMASGPGDIADLAQRLRGFLGVTGALQQAGQSRHVSLVCRDGAPAFGRFGGTGPDVLAGLGATGAFLAPAMARWLCGVASADENAWFGARLVTRDASDSPVSEIGALP